MKKKIRILILMTFLLMLSGCSNVNDYLTSKLEEKTWENFEILEDQDYQKYLHLKQEGELDENGYYLEEDEDPSESGDSEEPSGQIHVTFAENLHIRFTYYLDAERTEQINTLSCYLNPGDSIYASEPEIINAYSDKYVFSEFRIHQFDSNDQQESVSAVLTDDKLVFEIPADYAGDKLSVMPLGRYEPRILTLDDRYLDDDGNEVEFHGIWWVDSVEVKETTAEINSTEDYKVSYDYSNYANDFYFVKSNPEPFRTDDSGIIEFSEATAQNGCENYYVLLHRYINVRVSNGGYSLLPGQNKIKSLTVNSHEQDDLNKKELMLEGLKCRDEIVIRVDNSYEVTVSGLDITASIDLENGNVQEYKITVPETVERELGITVSKKTATLGVFAVKTVNNAKITVMDEDGKLLQNGDKVDDNEKLTVTITPESGYYVTGKKVDGDIYQDTMRYKEYISDIEKIVEEHPVKKLISVTLDTSDDYGDCVYTVDGKEVSGTVTLREGQKVKLEYTMTDSNYQIDSGLFGSKSKTETIDVSEDFEGRTLSREDFNIQIKGK